MMEYLKLNWVIYAITITVLLLCASFDGVWVSIAGILICTSLWTRKTYKQYRQNSDDNSTFNSGIETELIDQFDGLAMELHENVASLTGKLKQELGQVQSLVADSVITLQGSFHGINEQSQNQLQEVQEMLARVSDKISFDSHDHLSFSEFE